MVTRWGMSDEIGPIALESDGGRTMFGSGVQGEQYSERVSALIDGEVSKIMNNALKVAHDVLTKHKKVLDAIALKLVEVETIEQEAFNQLIAANGIVAKTKENTAPKQA
jgi:cell division protease FtsH